MTDHLKTIREAVRYLAHEFIDYDTRTSKVLLVHSTLDALEAENLRLREAATIAAVDYEFQRKKADRATAAMYDMHYAIKDAGWHPGRTDDKLTDIIRAKGKYMRELQAEREALHQLLPGTYYMDPPDGGSVELLDQLERMAKDAARYRYMRNTNVPGFSQSTGTTYLLWQMPEYWDRYGCVDVGKQLDAAIDKQMKEIK